MFGRCHRARLRGVRVETTPPDEPRSEPHAGAAPPRASLPQRLVYRARRWGGLTIVGVFRGGLLATGWLRPRGGRAPAGAWPEDRPLVSVWLGDGAQLGAQTLDGAQQLSGDLAAAWSAAEGKYLAVVPAGSTCDPTLLEKAVLVLEAGPELGFVCAFAGGSAVPLETDAILAQLREAPDRAFALVARGALGGALPKGTDLPALLQRIHAAVWEGAVLREPLVHLGDVRDAAVLVPKPRTHPVARLVPAALMVGLREAWRDHRRARRGGASAELADYGRAVQTRAPERATVLCLVPWLRTGGAEAVLRNLMAGLPDHHFVLCPTIDIEHDWRDAFTGAGAEVFALPELLPRSAWLAFLERLVEAKQAQVLLNAHSEFGYEMAARLRRRFPRLRAFDLLHNDSELGYIRHASVHDRAYDGHIVVSRRIKQTLVEQYGVAAERVHAITNGIDVHGRFDPVRYAATRSGDFAVGFVGRLSDEKDPLLFVEMAAALAKSDAPCRFVMAGDGPMAGKVRDRVQAAGLAGRFDLLGHVDDVPAVLAGLDLVTLTSKVEGCPLVALEAMAMGCTVVGTSAGNLVTLLQEPLGRSVAERTAPALAAAVIEELATCRDTERRAAIRAYVAARHGMPAMARAYAKLFDGAESSASVGER